MNDQATLSTFAAAVETLPIETWQAWKLGERDSRPIPLTEVETLDEAIRQAMLASWQPGDRLAVLYTHLGRNKRTLWLFAIKRSTKVYDYRPSTNGGAPVRVGRLYPERLIETQVQSFAPVEAFDAFRDNAVGRDLQLISGDR